MSLHSFGKQSTSSSIAAGGECGNISGVTLIVKSQDGSVYRFFSIGSSVSIEIVSAEARFACGSTRSSSAVSSESSDEA